MTQQKPFTIDRVSWHTKVKGNIESMEEIKARFKAVVTFLQSNGLTTRVLLASEVEPDDEFAILSSDLTIEGVALMKKGYDRWLKQVVNKGKDTADMSLLRKTLETLRNAK